MALDYAVGCPLVMEYVLKLIRSLMSFSVFHWPHLRWGSWTRGKGPWKHPAFNPVTWISMTGPYAERSLASPEDERDFSHRPPCQGLIHVGNYSSHYRLQAWSQVAEATITLSVKWARGAHPHFQHLWSWAGIFCCSSFKVFESKCPEAHGLRITNMNPCPENPELTCIERKVVRLWMRREAKNTQEEYGIYFKKQKNVSCNLKCHSLSDKVAVSPKLLWS